MDLLNSTVEIIAGIVTLVGGVIALLVTLRSSSRDATPEICAWPIRYQATDGEKFGVQVKNPGKIAVHDLRLVSTTGFRRIYPRDLYLTNLPPGDMVYTNNSSWTSPGWGAPQSASAIHGLSAVTQNPNWRVLGLRYRDTKGRWWVIIDGDFRKVPTKETADQAIDAAKQGYRAEMAAKKTRKRSSPTNEPEQVS